VAEDAKVYSEYIDLTDAEADAYYPGDDTRLISIVIRSLIPQTATVLDIGCGRGVDAYRYPPSLYWGIDISPALIRAAKRRNPQHTFTCMDARQLPWPNRYIDYAVANCVLDNSPTQEIALAIFQEARRVAKTLLVGWHTVPVLGLAEPITKRVGGHFGKQCWHSVFQKERFTPIAREEWCHGHMLWIIDNDLPFEANEPSEA
jgi:SAM-dependent methyltransferase